MTTTGPALGPAAASRRSQLSPARRGVREVGLALITAGVVILLFVVYQLWGTTLTEQHDQAVLAHDFATSVANHHQAHDPAVIGASKHDLAPAIPTGIAIDHIVIPSIHVNKYVVQGTDTEDLSEGPGHYVGTPLPGQPGNVAIAGHRTTYGAPFYELGNLHRGAYIYLTNTAGETFAYRVAYHEVVAPTDVAVLDDTPDNQLTLTTCNPIYSATSRLVVVADLVGRPLTNHPAATSAAHTSVPPATASHAASTHDAASIHDAAASSGNGLGGGQPNAWPPALAYGAAALVAWVLTRVGVAHTRRWSRLGVALAGLAVTAVPLWFCFENVTRILPASM